DNSGNIASDWEQLGETFTSDFDTSNENAQLRSYQNKLIFSYRADEAYKLFIIDPVNLDETVAYTLPFSPGVYQQEFLIGNRFYYIHDDNSNLVMYCYDLENYFAQVWVKVIADNVRSNFAIKKLNNRFVIVYPQGEEGSEKVYLRTVSFRGNSDQYEEGYALPLNWARQYAPSITIADNNSVYVNRIENNSKNIPGVFTDLIDLSYFVPNSSEDVAPMVAQVSNYPNPFNPETTISYAVPQTGKVKIDVYNIKGQKVKTLVNEHRTAGQHSVVWNGTDNDNKQVSSGVYLYKMKSGKFSTTNKMILMK
ncbi:MAG: FlgD immunoglobulin-like domain containing protein, partial [Candidatus Cloacimonadales bacterium]